MIKGLQKKTTADIPLEIERIGSISGHIRVSLGSGWV